MPSAPPKHTRKPAQRTHTVTTKQYDRRRGTANSRGYNYKWQRAREWFLSQPENALCACGCGGLSEVVDHSEPHRGDMELFWDMTKWRGMTKKCHDRKTAREDGGFGQPGKNNQ